LCFLFSFVNAQTKVLYINSYHEGYKSAIIQTNAVKDILLPKNIVLKFVHMNTKQIKKDSLRKLEALKIKKIIQQWKPNLVIASDDAASKYVVKEYYRDAKLPFVPVSYEKQKRALQFLKDYVFKDDVLKIPKTLLMKARSNAFKWNQRGPVDTSVYFTAARRAVIRKVFSNATMTNIVEFHEKVSDKHLSLADLFEEFHSLVFADIDALAKGETRVITTINMDTQKFFLGLLTDYALKKKSHFVPKVEGYAKFSISLLKDSLVKAIKTSKASKKFALAEQQQHLKSLLSAIDEMEKVVLVKTNRDHFFR
ncbi:zinc-dependent metalloprotease, partial [bacterium]|nr:zinc-dependent metalloprotease [bacterium]